MRESMAATTKEGKEEGVFLLSETIPEVLLELRIHLNFLFFCFYR